MSEQITATAPAEEMERLVQAARDAVTDDMVARLAENAGEAMALLDKVNRSGLDRAIPVIADLVNNGDLDRLVRLARVYGSAEDALTDEMIGRLTETAANGLALLDRVNRANLEGALPVLSRLVADGDLDRIAQLARVVGAAQDAVTDDMVGRLAETLGEGISVVDRLNRSGVGQLVDLLEALSSSGALAKLADGLPRLIDRMDMLQDVLGCIEKAADEVKGAPPASGSIFETLRMMREPQNQEFLRFALAAGRRLREVCGRRSR